MHPSPTEPDGYAAALQREAERAELPIRPLYHRRGEDFPEWIQRQIDDADPLPAPWSPAHRLALGAGVAALVLALLVFGAVGVVAVFGVKL